MASDSRFLAREFRTLRPCLVICQQHHTEPITMFSSIVHPQRQWRAHEQQPQGTLRNVNNILTLVVFIIGTSIVTYLSINQSVDVDICKAIMKALMKRSEAIASAATVFLSTYKFGNYVRRIIKSASSAFSVMNQSSIDLINVAAVVVDDYGVIMMCNKKFTQGMCNNEEKIGETASQFIESKDIRDYFNHDGIDVHYNDKWYVAFGVLAENGGIIYFIDNSLYKANSDEYLLSRPIVTLIDFDNKSEIERASDENVCDQISIFIESKLQEWAAGMKGFYKKLEKNDMYLVVIEERNIQALIEQKFKILETIRNIRINDVSGATISIGVGRGGKNLRECELRARQALEMAHGRGGDQAAVNNGEGYEFFGGTSKGVEKRDKVRTRVISAALEEQIRKSDKVIIMGHRFSDLDSVGAAVGMWSTIQKGMDMDAFIAINKQQSLAGSVISNIEKTGSLDVFIDEHTALNEITERTLLIVVDTHSPSFLEFAKVYKKCKRVVVIDHHRMMVNHIENAIIFYHEPYSSSASEMVAELIQYLGSDNLTRLEAEALLAGIMLDTKNFVLRTGVRTFEAAAFLRGKGADTVEVKRLFSNSISTYKTKYKLVSEAEIFNFYAIACADEETSDIRVAAAQAADELLGIENVKASFVMFPTKNCINISGRSLGDVNVQVLMEKMGGGGHQTMAATQLKGVTMEEAREQLVKIVSSINSEQVHNPAEPAVEPTVAESQ